MDEYDFKLLRQLHRHDYEEHFSPPPPDMLTDHLNSARPEETFDRMVAHYFQPHTPYIVESYRTGRPLTAVEDDPWTVVRTGTATKDEIWNLYLDNLRLALDSAERLLENIDAENVVISADHGDLFGEFGAYGHPEGFLHPNLRRAPWVETIATDRQTDEQTVDVERQGSGLDFETQLRDLGYL